MSFLKRYLEWRREHRRFTHCAHGYKLPSYNCPKCLQASMERAQRLEKMYRELDLREDR